MKNIKIMNINHQNLLIIIMMSLNQWVEFNNIKMKKTI